MFDVFSKSDTRILQVIAKVSGAGKIEFSSKDKHTNEFELNFKDNLTILESNRNRLRNLCSMILTSCSIFLSTSFAIILFIIKEKQNSNVILALIFSDLTFITSIFFSLFSAYLREPKAIITQLELINNNSLSYKKEQRYTKISITFLFIGILSFFIGLIVFIFKIML